MANSVHTHLIWLPAFFVCFQDITISISSFISHPSGHFFSISLLPLPHLLDTHALDCPGISRWTTFLFYPSTWFLHLMSNGHLKYNLSQTKPLIFSFKIRSSHSFFHTISWPFYFSRLLRTKPWRWEWFQQNRRVGSSKFPPFHRNIKKTSRNH